MDYVVNLALLCYESIAFTCPKTHVLLSKCDIQYSLKHFLTSN